MSGGEDKGAMPPMANEDESGAPVSLKANEGEGKIVTAPTVDDGLGIDHVSRAMSYERGTDHIEPVINEGEVKYEGKGKSRTESFSHLPAHGDSAPSTAPTSRRVSQAQTASEPSTAPSTRPVSQAQAESKPSTIETTSSVNPEQGSLAANAAHGDPGPNAGHRHSAPVAGQGDSVAVAAKDESSQSTAHGSSALIAALSTLPPKNQRRRHDCGCTDVFDHTGKKRQQACDLHKLNPMNSVLPLPTKKPLSETTNSNEGTRRISVYTPQAQRTEESPPRQPPVVTPTKGRNFVQGSENGPTFLDPFNSERAIEPTGPPNTLTTIPTQEDVLLKMPPGRVSSPNASAPKVLDPAAPGSSKENTLPYRKSASEPSGAQPQKSAAKGGPDLGSKAQGEQREVSNSALGPGRKQEAKVTHGEKIATDPQKSESSDDCDEGGVRVSDEHHHEFTVKEGRKHVGTASGPAFKKETVQPKSILKKTIGTTAEARQDGSGRAPSEQVNGNEEPGDGAGARLFQETVGRLKAGEGGPAANNAGGPIREEQGGVPVPSLILDTDAGPLRARTNSNDEPVFYVPRGSRSGAEDSSRVERWFERWCKDCVLM